MQNIKQPIFIQFSTFSRKLLEDILSQNEVVSQHRGRPWIQETGFDTWEGHRWKWGRWSKISGWHQKQREINPGEDVLVGSGKMFLPEDKLKDYQVWNNTSSTDLLIAMKELGMGLLLNPKNIKQMYI